MSSHPTRDQARYAIYLAPEQGSALAGFVSALLGYDAHTGLDVAHPHTPAAAADWPAITTEPRRYGAHATLKAPFHLAPGMSRATLAEALATFAADRPIFDIGPLAVTCVSRDDTGGFVALTNPHHSTALTQLEADAVAHFEPFRAALSPAEIARRQPDKLTPRQMRNLTTFGYPFVNEDFAFHITLTNRLASPEGVADHVADRLAQEVGTVRFRVDTLYLFEQPAADARFRAIGRYPLGAHGTARSRVGA